MSNLLLVSVLDMNLLESRWETRFARGQEHLEGVIRGAQEELGDVASSNATIARTIAALGRGQVSSLATKSEVSPHSKCRLPSARLLNELALMKTDWRPYPVTSPLFLDWSQHLSPK